MVRGVRSTSFVVKTRKYTSLSLVDEVMIASGNVRVNPSVVSQDMFPREATSVFCKRMELGVSS